MGSDLRAARDHVLVDNTAQAVFKHLDRISDRRSVLGRRWVWELLQNARDVAPKQGIKFELILNGSRLVCRHNGKPFAPEEIAHLIYHGSTKVDLDAAVGHFGSGFISTHLLSRRVMVRGRLDDGRDFNFLLDRSGKTVEDLRTAMDRSFDDFERSATPSRGGAATTEYEYQISDDADDLVKAGIAQLEVCGPLVLAFSPEIIAVEIGAPGGTWSIERAKPVPTQGSMKVLRFDCRRNGQSTTHDVALCDVDGSSAVAIQARAAESGLIAALSELVPRIFIKFPLLGTERLGFPVAINSMRFKPAEDRDGVLLDGDSVGVAVNRQVLEGINGAITTLLDYAAAANWRDIENSLAFDTSRIPDGVDKTWLSQRLSPLVEHARRTNLFCAQDGTRIPPITAWIPIGQTQDDRDALFGLAQALVDSKAKLPMADKLAVWSLNVGNWASLLGKDPHQLPEAFTVERLAQLVDRAGSLKNLGANLDASIDAADWLVGFLTLVHSCGKTKLFDDLALLPNQSGHLRKRRDLAVDGAIDETLKDIAEQLGLKLRDGLLDRRIAIPGLVALLGKKDQRQAIEETIQTLRQYTRGDEIKARLIKANVELFWWLYSNQEMFRLDGLPVATAEVEDDCATTLELSRNNKDVDRPVSPASSWDPSVREFASLFHERVRLHDAFALDRPSTDWRALADAGFLHLSPFYQGTRRLDVFVPEDHLDDDAEIDHQTIEALEVSDIALLSERDIGLLDAARKSRTKALDLISFLTNVAVTSDPTAFNVVTVKCECGETHRVFRGAWLAPLRTRSWVPIAGEERKTDYATAQSLAQLLEDSPDLVTALSNEPGSQLLDALGISRADFALRVVAKDESSRLSLIRSASDLSQLTGGDPERLREVVDEMREHPEIIDAIEEQKETRERIQRNQNIGTLVETLLQQALSEYGLRVTRTGRGSDFEVENDFIINNEEVLLSLGGTLIEVKSTRSDSAKMTPLQAETACRHGERFALCVVALSDAEPTLESVRQSSKFVFGIGGPLQAVWQDYASIQESTQAARRHSGPIALDLTDGQYRFRVDAQIWSNGLAFDHAVERFRGA